MVFTLMNLNKYIHIGKLVKIRVKKIIFKLLKCRKIVTILTITFCFEL